MSRIHKSWLVLFALCGLAAASIGISINTSGVFYSVVSEDLGFYRGAFAFNMTIFSLVNAIAGLFVVRLLQKWSLKKILLASVTLAGLATALMALSRQLWQFYLLAGIRGLATGMFSIMTLTLVINYWFHEKNGLATSIAFSFSGITGALLSPVLARLIEHQGWQFAYLVQAGLLSLFCLPALLLPFQVDPESEGQKPYGAKEVKRASSFSEGNLRLSAGFFAMLVFALVVSFVSSMAQHFPGFADSIGLGVSFGASLLSMGMIGNIISKLLVGFLSDKIGPFKACFIFLSLHLASILLLIMCQQSLLLLLAAFLFGSCFGILAVSVPLLTRELFGLQAYGKVYPIINFATNFGAAIAFSAIGFIYDWAHSYYPALMTFVVFLILALLSLTFARQKSHTL